MENTKSHQGDLQGTNEVLKLIVIISLRDSFPGWSPFSYFSRSLLAILPNLILNLKIMGVTNSSHSALSLKKVLNSVASIIVFYRIFKKIYEANNKFHNKLSEAKTIF